MARILHTADVHLRPEHPERRAALRTLLDRAEADGVDVVTIGGDLFDRPEDVEERRATLRNDLFSDRPFRIVLIPGNHDVEAYRGDVFFGDSCTVLLEEPFEHWTAPDESVRITGLPYRERPDDDLLLALQDRSAFDGTEVLLLHCSLDAPFDVRDTGDEGDHRYFPVTGELLAELGFDYYLAGHYHSPHRVSLAGGGVFTYPGTPASTRRSETGPRRVSLLNPAGDLRFETLETFHYASETFGVAPGSEEAVLVDVREWADRHAVEGAEATVTVEGFIETDEDEFYEDLVRAADPATVADETRNASHLLAHPLFASFEEELADVEWDLATKRAVTERTLAVFSRLAARGEL